MRQHHEYHHSRGATAAAHLPVANYVPAQYGCSKYLNIHDGAHRQRDDGGNDENDQGRVVEAVDEQLHPRLRIWHGHPVAAELGGPLLQVVVCSKPLCYVALQHLG